MVEVEFSQKTKTLIDNLKGVCTAYGLGNDGNEYKIITQAFLYKFLNDKFVYLTKQADKKLAAAPDWYEAIKQYSPADYDMLLLQLGGNCAELLPEHTIPALYQKQWDEDTQFSVIFDSTLHDIAVRNNEIFSVKTDSGAKIQLFDPITQYISDPSRRDDFARALINKIVEFSFEDIFEQKFDFFATIFEYMISDYNKDGGGKYAEYYTPHAVAKIMAQIMVPHAVEDVTCYDPSAGTGSLLMNLAHAIGEENCTIYTQDISQKSSGLLRLNLILNNLVHSISNVIQANTLTDPYHKGTDRKLMKFDYIVSNPPFKLDFSDDHTKVINALPKDRFFAGIPNIPNKDKNGMSIYLLFIQHIMYSLAPNGKAAIVVPTGFITAQSGIEKKIRQRLVDERMLAGVVSMPSNIFATTGTNVSILFLDKANKQGNIVLIDASKLGTTVKEGKNQKTQLSYDDEQKIIETFHRKEAVDDFSVAVSYEQIADKNYSLSAGQYFEVKIEYVDITPEEFAQKMNDYTQNLDQLFAQSRQLEEEIKKQLGGLGYE